MNKRDRESWEVVKEEVGEHVSEAHRFTIDSVLGDHLRVLVAELEEPVWTGLGPQGLAPFGLWGDEKERVVTRKKAKGMIGVGSRRLKERRVFVRIAQHSFEMTGQVRQHAKESYSPLLQREHLPSVETEGSK